MSRGNRCYNFIINMIESSTYEDRELLSKFAEEDPYNKNSLYYMIGKYSRDYGAKSADYEQAYEILIEALSDYIIACQTSYSSKRRLFERVSKWCKHIGNQYCIQEVDELLKNLPEQYATDVSLEIIKDLHDQEGWSKEALAERYGVSEKTVQVLLHKISNQRCKDPIRIGGQAVYVPVAYKEKAPDIDIKDKRKRVRMHYTENTMSPLVFQMNIMQVETLLKSFQLNYDSGNDIPMDLAVHTWGQLSDYAKERIREIFGKRDPELMRFLDEVAAADTDEYRFMTEAELFKNSGNYAERLNIAYKGKMICNISLIGPHRTRKRQRICYDYNQRKYYAVSADDPSSERLYFTEDDLNIIEES